MPGQEASPTRSDRIVLNHSELFASIFDAMPDAAVVTDLQSRVQLVNRRFQQLFAVEAPAVEGQPIHSVLDTDFPAFSTQGSFTTIYRSTAGREFPGETVVTEVRDHDNQLAGYIYSIRDVSDSKTAAEALRTSESQYRALFERANDALIIFEPEDECILEVNPRACELYGFTRDEFIARSLQTLTEDVGRGRGAIKDIIQNGGIRNFESRHFCKDGRALQLQISCSLISFNSRDAVLTIIRDISDQKATERALRAAKEAAEEATRLKSEFVAKVSHEIRTPMNGVMGMAELLKETTLTESQREYAESIANSGEALLALINDLLDFSKIEAGKLELEKIPFDPYRMVGEVVDLFAPRAEAKKTRIAYYIDSDVPMSVLGDPHRIRQVLTNLVANAVKFTDDGEIIVNVTAQDNADGQTAIVFDVTDSGIGIPLEKQDSLFEAFTQADSATTRQFGGTGLGLAISRELATLMNGSIDLQSTYGEGSTFRFSVVLEQPLDEDTPSSDHGATLGRLRVLVVDQSVNIRSIICRYLDSWDVDVHEAGTGSEALRAVSACKNDRPFDVILIDDSLSDIESLSLARALRAVSAESNFHVVLLTSFKERSLTDAAADAGVDAVLPHPIWPHRLRQCLATVVAGKPAAEISTLPVRGADSDNISPYGTASILLVEDNLTNQKVASAMLARMGHDIEIARNGAEALQKIEQVQYDLILMDCQMPVMDGFEATRQIRNLPGDRSRVPVIALTANAVKGDRERCLAAGMDDYLTKPFRPDLIREALERWLSGKAAA